jgi:phospholipid/cholesterol/gamma-HCH transport system permease protein
VKNSHDYVQLDSALQLTLHGEWVITNVSHIKSELKNISFPSGDITIDASHISKMDSAGAWVLDANLKKIREEKRQVEIVNISEQYEKLLTLIDEQTEKSEKKIPKLPLPNFLERLGRYGFEQGKEFLAYLSFIGELGFESLRLLRKPMLWRGSDVIGIINKTGTQALPIVALLSFMIGIVISYQMGNQLRNYGANIFIVDLLGLSVLREFGPLLTAIMVSGRTGSAFTAQLGIMKINQEIDALDAMGVTPAELLLLPRLIALLITMPLLTMWANCFGILGGMTMAGNMLNVSWHDFLLRFQQEIPLRALIIGLSKAPIFALIIASIGCFQGMQVRGSAESVGVRTTRSVVLSIFFIIVTDAILSVIFSELKL